MAQSPLEKTLNKKQKFVAIYKKVDMKTASDMLLVLTFLDTLPRNLTTEKQIKDFINDCHVKKNNELYNRLRKRNTDMFISGEVVMLKTVVK